MWQDQTKLLHWVFWLWCCKVMSAYHWCGLTESQQIAFKPSQSRVNFLSWSQQGVATPCFKQNCTFSSNLRYSSWLILNGLPPYLHLNYLIAQRVKASYWQFGTLSIGIFFVKFGLKTAWDISYDSLWSLLKCVNIWQLQGHLNIFAKIGYLQKIKDFLMKGVISLP